MASTDRRVRSGLGPRLRAARLVVADVTDSRAAEAGEPVSVSVVIPTYQHGRYVGEAAASALAQEVGERHEVIVVDDGSTDGTRGVLRELVAATSGRLRYARLTRNLGRSTARNAGIALARAPIVAFTDGDCSPAPGWLDAATRSFGDPSVGVVQGATLPRPDRPRPFFNHFIETTRFDGSFSTSNVVYRRAALVEVDGFDPSMDWGEDADLGWRVVRAGWGAAFAPDALVHHDVVPLSVSEWLKWPLHFASEPAKAARHAEYRRYLFLGLWLTPFHALFDLAVLAVLLAARVHRAFLLLALPYVLAFPRRHGLGGRWPPAKACLHLAWDGVSLGALLAGSIRHRAAVL